MTRPLGLLPSRQGLGARPLVLVALGGLVAIVASGCSSLPPGEGSSDPAPGGTPEVTASGPDADRASADTDGLTPGRAPADTGEVPTVSTLFKQAREGGMVDLDDKDAERFAALVLPGDPFPDLATIGVLTKDALPDLQYWGGGYEDPSGLGFTFRVTYSDTPLTHTPLGAQAADRSPLPDGSTVLVSEPGWGMTAEALTPDAHCLAAVLAYPAVEPPPAFPEGYDSYLTETLLERLATIAC